MSAAIETAKGFQPSMPQSLFRTGITSAANHNPYAVAKDGGRFLLPVVIPPPGHETINVVLNWPAILLK